MAKKKTIVTTWEIFTYDVWGGPDGWTVNDRFRTGKQDIVLAVEIRNPGTAAEFASAHPTNRQVRKALGLSNVRLDLDGDDITIYVERDRDGYPLGEMRCVSHGNLSPLDTPTNVM